MLCFNTNLYFLLLSFSIRPIWRPRTYLWLKPRPDTLALTSRYSLLPAESFEKHCLRLWVPHQGECVCGIILFTGAADCCPTLNHESTQAIWDNHLNNTPVQYSESPAWFQQGDRGSTSHHCDVWIRMLLQIMNLYEPIWDFELIDWSK